MINNKRVLAIITARCGSKGLPNKNVMILGDKPLLAWPIEAARNSDYVDKVIVSTDSKKIAEIAISYNGDVPFLRPAEFATDESPSFEAVNYTIESLAKKKEIFDYVVLLEPTSPLTESSDIDSALEIIYSNQIGAKSIVGVTENIKYHPSFSLELSNGLLESFSKELSKTTRRQDLKKNYIMDGSLYISEIQYYRKMKTFYHNKTLPYITPYWKSFEIDTIEDFWAIESIIINKKKVT